MHNTKSTTTGFQFQQLQKHRLVFLSLLHGGESDLVRLSELYSRACRDVARAAMAAISSLAAEADSIVTVLLFSFWRWQGTKASSTISIWRLERYMQRENNCCGKPEDTRSEEESLTPPG